MHILVTGGAGFIGSNLVDRLSTVGTIGNQPVEKIVVIDNLFLGKKAFIQPLIDRGVVDFYQQDLLDFAATLKIFEQYHFGLVFHLSANSDIAYGANTTDWDLKQGTLVTYNVLEAMRQTGVPSIVFSSTSAIYGETDGQPLAENYGPLLPISLYGASKLASEGLITAFCHNYDLRAWLFRFGNVVGHNGTHGVLVDFIRQLRTDPTTLTVLGDGTQAKPYLHVGECVEGILFGYERAAQPVNYYNLACAGATAVSQIAALVIRVMGLTGVKIKYTGGDRGWRGDVPQVRLNPDKFKTVGWAAKLSSDQAVAKAIDELLRQSF